MPRPPIWYLKKIELFDTLSDDEMMDFIDGMEHCEFPAKHIVYTADDCVEHTYILKEGEVTLYQTVEGKKIIVDILKPGAIFGNIGFDCKDIEKVYAEISQKSYVCKLPQNFFVQLIGKHPGVAMNAFKLLSKRMTQYQSQLKFLSILNARERILATVKLINEKDDKSILPEILRMPTKVTHEKLAGMTGLTRETVTKQLLKLEEEALISVHKKNIRLTDAGNAEIFKLI